MVEDDRMLSVLSLFLLLTRLLFSLPSIIVGVVHLGGTVFDTVKPDQPQPTEPITIFCTWSGFLVAA